MNKIKWAYYCTSRHHLDRIWKRGFIKAPFLVFDRPQDAARACSYGKNRIILMMELPSLHEVLNGNQGLSYIIHSDYHMEKTASRNRRA